MSQLPSTLHALNPGSQIRTQQSRVCRFMRQTVDSRESLIDSCCRRAARLKVNAVAGHHDTVQSQTRF